MTTPKGKVTFDQIHIEQHNIPPWPEWSDSYINSLQWSRTAKHFNSMAPGMGASPGKTKTVMVESDESYEDPAGLVEMPPDIEVYSWRRPIHINPELNYVVEPDPTPLDLVSYNKHIMHYEIVRAIISNITCLERESFYRPFPVEFQSDQFVANGGVEWKPWHHVYALTNAGKGQVHNPQYNPFGKYVIRLFYLGKWRRVLVDDRLPVDADGRLLLPTSRPDNLWLPLLSKALLRVACHSWLPPSHCVDFSVLHCLTGWVQTLIPCKGCSVYQLWCVCCQLMQTTEEVVASPGCCRSESHLSAPRDTTRRQSAVGSRAILATVSNTLSPKKSPALSGLREQTVLISGVRFDSEQPTPLWKQYRWNEWAYNKGIISEIPYKPIRNIKFYNPLEEYATDMKIPLKSEVWLDFEEVVQYIRTFEVFYKPSYFKYSLCAWTEHELFLPPKVAEDVVLRTGKSSSIKERGEGDAKSVKSKVPINEKPDKSVDLTSKKSGAKGAKGKNDKGKGAEDGNKVKEDWPVNLRKPSFFYLLTDSMCEKEFLCSLSVYSPERAPYAIIFIGKFEWHSPSVAPITSRMSTTASSAKFFLLPSGLRVFRIWYQFPAYFCVQLFSNTYFQNGSKMFIQQSLTCDSESFNYYGSEISSSFEQLLTAPQGGADHGRAFHRLMASMDPPQLSSRLPWPQWFCVHNELAQAFEESLTEMMSETVAHADDIDQTLQAFQLLFLNPVFGMKTLKSLKPEIYDYVFEQRQSKCQKELLLEQERRERLTQARSLDKGKKGAKSDKSNAKPIESPKSEVKTKDAKIEKVDKKDKDKHKVSTHGDQLKKLIKCKEKYLLINDPKEAIILIKKMMSKVPHLRHLYPFHPEDDIKLVFKDYMGELHASDLWVVLVRCVMNIHAVEPVPCSLHVWSPVENLVVRLIDNDTDEEILPLGFVENNVAYLTRKNRGYTLCVYGVVDHLKPVPWRLRSVGMREIDCLHICKENVEECTNPHTNPPEQHQQTLHGYYVPNKENVIAKCLLEVKSDVTVMLRLHLSHRYTICRLVVTDETRVVVSDTSGSGEIMESVLHLKGPEESIYRSINSLGSVTSGSEGPKPVVYRVVATLLDSSWPLEPLQMKAMLYYKEHLPAILYRQTEKKSLERLGSVNEQLKESPRKRPRLERLSSLKSPQDPDFVHFESISNKPSWSLTLVTDLQEEMPITLHLDTSLYDLIKEMKTQWEKEGINLDTCKSLRKDFLRQLEDESLDDYSEETVFKLKPKKLDRLTERYGEKVCDDWLQEPVTPSESLVSSVLSMSDITSNISPPVSQHMPNTASDQSLARVLGSVKSTPQVSHESSSKSSSLPIDGGRKLDHTNILVQQEEIHKALQKIRERTLDHFHQIFKETTDLREQILNDMKIKKEAQLETEKSKPDSKKGNKSRDSSPTDTKAKKSSVQDAKKSKGGKVKKK